MERSIDFSLDKPFIIVTYHPVTLENNSSERQFKNLLEALESVKSYKVIFTKANSDTDGRIINKLIDEYVEQNKNYAVGFTSLGIKRYCKTLHHG